MHIEVNRGLSETTKQKKMTIDNEIESATNREHVQKQKTSDNPTEAIDTDCETTDPQRKTTLVTKVNEVDDGKLCETTCSATDKGTRLQVNANTNVPQGVTTASFDQPGDM